MVHDEPTIVGDCLAVAGACTSSRHSSPVANRIITPSALIRRVIYEMRFNASAEAMLTIAADPNHLVPASPSRRYAVAVSPISNAYGFILGASIHPRGTRNVSASCGKQERGCGIGSLAFTPGAIRLGSMLHIEDRSIDVLGDAALCDGTPK